MHPHNLIIMGFWQYCDYTTSCICNTLIKPIKLIDVVTLFTFNYVAPILIAINRHVNMGLGLGSCFQVQYIANWGGGVNIFTIFSVFTYLNFHIFFIFTPNCYSFL